MIQMIDPPNGYLYGFPKLFAPAPGQSIDNYLLSHGYPQHEIDKWPGGVPSRIWKTRQSEFVIDRSRSLKDRRRLSGPAVRTFVNIANEWNLDAVERLELIDLGRNEYKSVVSRAQAHKAAALPTARLMRLSAIFNIYSGLQTLFGDVDDRSVWLRSGNDYEPFSGLSPLRLMREKDLGGLFDVASFLKARTAGN